MRLELQELPPSATFSLHQVHTIFKRIMPFNLIYVKLGAILAFLLNLMMTDGLANFLFQIHVYLFTFGLEQFL